MLSKPDITKEVRMHVPTLHNRSILQNIAKKSTFDLTQDRSAVPFKAMVLLSAFFLLFVSCNTPSEKVEDAQDKVDMATSDLDEANKMYQIEVDSFKADVNRQIAANEMEIQRLKAERKQRTTTQSESYDTDLTDLQLKLEKLKIKLNNYEANQRDGWASFKAELASDMNNLGAALKEFTKK